MFQISLETYAAKTLTPICHLHGPSYDVSNSKVEFLWNDLHSPTNNPRLSLSINTMLHHLSNTSRIRSPKGSFLSLGLRAISSLSSHILHRIECMWTICAYQALIRWDGLSQVEPRCGLGNAFVHGRGNRCTKAEVRPKDCRPRSVFDDLTPTLAS